MAGNIRLTPDELREFARQYNNESANVQDLIGRLDGMSGQLQEIWEGASSEAFAAQYQELRPSFEKMSTLLAEVSQQLNNSANTLEETDQNIAGQIRG
ncbi:WXG100 family type VII secretion target [Halobacillus litoralis]|uniref:WXG100 family type VII secretion target n=1 Tax=Halobacillus litoralis TaxID=45668 RepID=UPI001CD7E853|nr:WXG100 family type VII secretion target [Halobacillus litoralis]MCA0970750.1 WXG100 family type VII secretion target [Halobacillus litoralis]